MARFAVFICAARILCAATGPFRQTVEFGGERRYCDKNSIAIFAGHNQRDREAIATAPGNGTSCSRAAGFQGFRYPRECYRPQRGCAIRKASSSELDTQRCKSATIADHQLEWLSGFAFLYPSLRVFQLFFDPLRVIYFEPHLVGIPKFELWLNDISAKLRCNV